MRIDFDTPVLFHDLHFLAGDTVLQRAVRDCIEAQKRAAAEKARNEYVPDAEAERKVSPEALDELLAANRDVSDIRTNSDLSNCIVFHTTQLAGSVIDQEVLTLRERADRIVIAHLAGLFDRPCTAGVSGHFWYPPGGFMGWHTNLRKPGWRLYVNYAEEPGRSFFRYRDPETGAVVTSIDRQWNFRLFRITPARPFWHAVYSQTNRFSLGYMVTA